jgi:flagellar hook-basal body complex protein FliE
MDNLSIDAIGRAGGLSPLSVGRNADATGASGFADALGKALSSVNDAQERAHTAGQKFQMSDPDVTLEETMIAMQTANISFQSLVQVRNRLISAYRDIMNMQV